MGGPALTLVDKYGIPVTEAPEGYGAPFTIVSSGGIPATLVASGGLPINAFNLDSYLSGLADAAYYDFSDTSTLFQDTSATTPVTATGQSIARANDQVNSHNAVQANGTLQPKYQTLGAKFDGSDDYLSTGYLPAAGGNFIVAHVTIPASLGSIAMLFGAQDASSTNRFWMGVDDSTGRLRAGVGTNNAHYGTTDLRGSTAMVGLSIDGSTVKLFVEGAQELSASQSGSPTTTNGLFVGANNGNGFPGLYHPGYVKKLVAGRASIDLTRYLQIRSALLA